MKYVKCMDNKGYEKYLKRGGVYRVAAETERYYYILGVGDFLFPRHIFAPILPPAVAMDVVNDNEEEDRSRLAA